ncbi:hypothetical protein [Geomonas ferrireducens]|uniref:hypothetical protein n=1 Tax=Geomonas ferrireducens TaxID=2570227 RepID=UPI0010A77DFC|nr:hypothetical protein [Geomonas ferrireducens]
MRTLTRFQAKLFTILALTIAAVALEGLNTAAHADETPAATASTKGICPYSLMLQKSVEAQKAYLAKVEKAKMNSRIDDREETADADEVETSGERSFALVSFSWGSRTR